MNKRNLSIIAGISYIIIFFAAIFANFFFLDALIENPLETIQQDGMMVRLGIMAFLITVVFDVVVAWALMDLFRKHPLTLLSTFFRLMHAAVFGVAIFALPLALTSGTAKEILMQVDIFNTIWLIGLFFFGIHLILLGLILKKPKIISIFLIVAGIVYIFDTSAHFLFPFYETYASIFLALVAIPSILGELGFSIWLLAKGIRNNY
jgi:hypothetical protein